MFSSPARLLFTYVQTVYECRFQGSSSYNETNPTLQKPKGARNTC